MVANQALRAAAENRPQSEVQALAVLAEGLGSPVEVVAPTASPSPSVTPSQTPTSTQTPMPQPTSTPEAVETQDSPTAEATGASQAPQPSTTPAIQPGPTSTTAAPYVLRVRDQVCDPALPGPLIQIWVLDSDRQPVPGVAVNISWPGGQERFFTGLKPEISPGYADYLMDPQIEYTLRVGDGGQTVSELRSQSCSDTAGSYPGAVQLEFQQP